jgi:hypothetical protein
MGTVNDQPDVNKYRATLHVTMMLLSPAGKSDEEAVFEIGLLVIDVKFWYRDRV